MEKSIIPYSQTDRKITRPEVSSKGVGDHRPPSELPSLEVLHQKNKFSEYVALNSGRLTFGRARGLQETDSTLNKCTQNLIHAETYGRSSTSKGAKNK